MYAEETIGPPCWREKRGGLAFSLKRRLLGGCFRVAAKEDKGPYGRTGRRMRRGGQPSSWEKGKARVLCQVIRREFPKKGGGPAYISLSQEEKEYGR